MDPGMSATQMLALAAKITKAKRESQHLLFEPIEKQKQACNSRKKTVLILGANRVGKTKTAAFIDTCHATGKYPDWWVGPRYTRPVNIAVVGKTNRATREVMQKALLGPIWDMGTGMIPKDCLSKAPTKQQGVADSVDTIFVNHVSGGVSSIQLYSCQMDVGVLMGQNLDLVDFDEEPTAEWVSQARMRIVSNNGFLLFTFTPEDGYTDVVNKLFEMDEAHIERIIITAHDAKAYYPAEELKRLEEELPEWEKEFRLYGRPSMGEKGRVFRYPRESYEIDPIDPEPTWRRVAGLDVGFGHATTAIDLYIDDSTPMATFYALQEYFSKEELPDIHSAKLRAWGDVDFYIDPSSKRRAPTDGNNLYKMYEDRGLNLVPANNDVDASIIFINQLLANRQLYVSKDCPNLLEQMGLYRRVVDKKTNRAIIHKKNQDCIDALRYAIMAHEYARVPYRRAPKPHELVPKVEIKQWKPFDLRMGY